AQIRFPRRISDNGERQGRPEQVGRVPVIPYADFTFFGLLLYAVVPTLILGLLGWAGWRWALFVTAAMLIVQYHGLVNIRSAFSAFPTSHFARSMSCFASEMTLSPSPARSISWPSYFSFRPSPPARSIATGAL